MPEAVIGVLCLTRRGAVPAWRRQRSFYLHHLARRPPPHCSMSPLTQNEYVHYAVLKDLSSLNSLISIEIAARAADHFTRLYYSTYDSDTRVDDLPNFYRPTSALTWNGTPYQGSDGVRQLLSKMPPTKHEVQSFDCHPIPGEHDCRCPLAAYVDDSTGSQPPSLLVTVSGTVIHGKGPAGNPPSTPAKSIDGQPRVFSQTFMLAPDPNAPRAAPGEVAKYFVNADTMRFVG